MNGDGIHHMISGTCMRESGYRQAGELFGIQSAATAGVQVLNDSISNIRLEHKRSVRRPGPLSRARWRAPYSPYVKLELSDAVDAVGRRCARRYFTFDVRISAIPALSNRPAGRTQARSVRRPT